MAKLTFQLGESKQVAEATMSFRLELAGQSFSFQPGQFVRVGCRILRILIPKAMCGRFPLRPRLRIPLC
jgi:ferredoxin-NADP reductase